MTRKPAVAGYFYPSSPKELRETVIRMIEPEAEKKDAYAIVSPHAGYVYSGAVAGAVFSSVAVPDTAVILGPCHQEIDSLFAIQSAGSWETPLGEIPIDEKMAEAIKKALPLVTDDDDAHRREHSLEVQVPFLQIIAGEKGLRLVPICISPAASFKDLDALGRALGQAVRGSKRKVLIVASTDMSHYVSREAARRKDGLAIDRILALDAEGLFSTVVRERISMCGFQPVTAALIAAKALGAKAGELVRYRTSGDVTGDDREVVGYAGIRIL